MKIMRDVWETDRWFTFPKFEETSEYLARTLREAGLKEVEIVRPPADGKTQFGYWTMPLAWDVAQATLEIIQPSVPDEYRVLADFQKIPSSLGMWSGPTPPEGIEAEVVELRRDQSLAGLDVKGKLVMTNRNPAGLKSELAAAGALGAINAFTENPDLLDGRQWVNAWGDDGWGYTATSTPLLCFSITPRQAAFVREQISKHGKLRVRAKADARYYEGAYPYVTALIPGADANGEETLLLGHTAEQGAHDNATGVAAMVEAVSAINRLIDTGKLQRPRRGIRIMAMGELYASMHYLAANPDRIKRTIGAMCIDTPAGFYNLAGTEYTFYLNPHSAKSFTDTLILQTAAAYFSKLRPARPWHWKEHMGGTDNYLNDPSIGIPVVWPYSGSGVHTHHNSEDKPDTVDERSLRDLTVVTAIYLYSLASAGEPEALSLAEASLSRGYESVAKSYGAELNAMLIAGSQKQLSELLHSGHERIDYTVNRESEAIVSSIRLVPNERRGVFQRSLHEITARLQAFGQEQRARLQDAAQRRASQLGLDTPIKPQAPPPNPQLSEAKKIIVKRKRFGNIPMDDLRTAERAGYPPAAWWNSRVAALYWCDGKRDLAEVIRLTRLEMGPDKIDYADYFRFLERRGYVEFVR